ncbi:hypothetical protein SAMN04487965_3280 [Microbulbifer donghaiensis]|uniref:MFS transporter permease n=1 Tax=Microbulbifer donghaiensis TaxID=494016 RepID=A0A1M5GWR6_9GAMM|nr:DUF6064 family protein [Microbulbifer donghaiensis]SHG08128.1 hypothetical protein SAMN04487965_3280 [Microbulbifer donghaiensis]
MSDWSSYELQDFIPFTADVYFRLLDRTNETFWPLHLLTLAMGCTALLCALSGRARIALLLIAPLWVFVGVAYFLQRYAELNWAGHYAGWAFIVQAGALVLIALTRYGIERPPRLLNIPSLAGTLIAALGLFGYPWIAPLSGYSPYQAETFGINPAPTAITTFGLILIVLRGTAMWLAAIVPFLWLILAGLTLTALGAPWANALLVTLVATLLAMARKNALEPEAHDKRRPGDDGDHPHP